MQICKLNGKHKITKNLKKIIKKENSFKLNEILTYKKFAKRVLNSKKKLTNLLKSLKKQKKTIISYGATYKSTTVFNFCNINSKLISYVTDTTFNKQGKFTPGGHIPIVNSEFLYKKQPDYILILPWNLSKEIADQNIQARSFNCKFVTAIPEIKIF